MKTKYIASILTILLIASIFTFGLTINKASAVDVTLSIPDVSKSPADLGNTFTVPVQISNVSDLFGFDIKITWNNALITFLSLDDSPLNTVFASYFEPLNNDTPHYQTGDGYVRFAAVKTGIPGFSNPDSTTTLYTITFTISKAGNFPYSTLMHFDTVKLSNSAADPITATLTDGNYSMSATKPEIYFTPVNPNLAKPYEYGKYFEVEVYATQITSTLTGYDLKVDYTSDLLMFVKVQTWGVLGMGTAADNSTTGVVDVWISGGTPSTGNNMLLFTLTFKVAFNDSIGHIWRTGSAHTIDATVSIDTTAGGLTFSEGPIAISGITTPSTITLHINLIQGDVTCNGMVDIFDLATVARFYDQSVPPAPEKYNVKTDGTMDIFDLVVVATNFNYYTPDSPP